MRLRTLFILLLLGPISALAGSVVIIDFDQANPPYMYVRDGTLRGIFPELCRQVFQRLHVPVELRARPWARALEELNTGSAGLCGLYETEERVRRLDFSDYLMEDTILVYSLKSKPVKMRKTWDLWGRNIGVMRGWSYGDEFDRYREEGMFQVHEVATDEQNFKMLASKRIDCLLAIPTSVANIAPSYPTIQPSPVPVAVNTTHLAFSKEDCLTCEPGYIKDAKRLLANWNHYDREFLRWLEDRGYELEWSDEWTTCSDCGGLIRTSPRQLRLEALLPDRGRRSRDLRGLHQAEPCALPGKAGGPVQEGLDPRRRPCPARVRHGQPDRQAWAG